MNNEQELPEGWAIVKLRDVTFSGGTRNPQANMGDEFYYVDIEAVDNTKQKIGAPKKLSVKDAPSRARIAIQKGDIIFSLVRPYLKNIAVIPEELDGQIASTAFCVMRPENGITNSYIYYTVLQQSFIDSIKTYGNNPPAGHDDEFLAMDILLAPTEEQHRIVSTLEEQFPLLDASIVTLKQDKAKLKQARASVLKAAVEGTLTQAWRIAHPDTEPASELLERILQERHQRWETDQLAKMQAKGVTPRDDKWKESYKEPIAPNVEDLPELPDGWCWATVESLSTKVVDGVHKKPNYISSGIPFITVRNLTAGPGISFDNLNHITLEDHQEFCKRANPEKGDILLSKDETLGVTRVIKTDIQFSIFVSVALIKPVQYVMSDYLGLALSSPAVQVQMVPKGTGLQHIHLEDLRVDCVPLPPLPEQQQIVAEVEERISVITQAETAVEASLKRAERTRQSILQKAFSGQLVPQAPDDESASVLLERIREERAMREQAKPDKKRKVHTPYLPDVAEPIATDRQEMQQEELWERVNR